MMRITTGTTDLGLSPLLRLRQALAFPIYTVALITSFLSDLLGNLAAKIAGDPR